MTKNIYLYTYHVVFNEWNDATSEEAEDIVRQEMKRASDENYAFILTGKQNEQESFFDAISAENLTKDFIWLHICPEELLEPSKGEKNKKRYYLFSFCACSHKTDYTYKKGAVAK